MPAVPIEILRCPATGQSLTEEHGSLITADGSRSYPTVDGVPILVDEADSIFSVAEIATAGGRMRSASAWKQRARRVMPSTALNVGTAERFARFVSEVSSPSAPRRPRVLVVGGGELGEGMEALAASDNLDLVETDIYLGPRVAVVCDGHRLPFADGAFDGVVVQAVLEHVASPTTVVDEIHRVLRDGGVVYAETPFMQQVHEGAYDFTRFTELGHRRLFRMFSELDRGVAVGPATALLWSLRYFARALPRRSVPLAKALDKAVTLLFFWIKYLDRRLVGHPGANDAASAVYFLGRRATSAIPDRALVATYRGTIRSADDARGVQTSGSAS